MMRKSLLVLSIILLFLPSCTKKAVKPVDNPGDLYVQGVEQMKKKKWDNAVADFAKVRESFPFDPIAVVAQIKQGDAYFEKKDYQLAGGTYEDFVNSYPDDENAAYALHRLGECYEKQALTVERDQAITLKAIERFTFLKNRYPASPYAKDADAHIAQLTQKLAAREFYVGEFYYRTGRYNASILRLEYFLNTYPAANDRDKALHYLVLDYRELHDPEKAQLYVDKLRQEYPKSNYSVLASRERPVATKQAAAPHAAAAPIVVAMDAPVDLTYRETKKREIDLRPIEAPPAEGVGSPPENAAKAAPSVAGLPADNEKDGAKRGEAEKGAAIQETGAAKEAATPAEKPTKSGHEDGDKLGTKAGAVKKDAFGLSNQKNPIDVVADTMEAFEKGKTNVFKGNVVVKQEGSGPGQTLYLFSDKVTAYRSEEENDIQRVDAEGNVRIVKADRTATCKQAFFYNDKHQIVLKGDVVVFEGKDRLTGDTVTYYLDEDRTHVEGQPDKRAHVTITPK
jgi:outer membrane protein assembly factor BamD